MINPIVTHPGNVANPRNFATPHAISGRLASKISKIEPQAAYIPNIMSRPKFGFSKATRHHRWAPLIRFLPTRSSITGFPIVVNLGVKYFLAPNTDSYTAQIRQGIAFLQLRRKLPRAVFDDSVKWVGRPLIANHGRWVGWVGGGGGGGAGISAFSMIRRL